MLTTGEGDENTNIIYRCMKQQHLHQSRAMENETTAGEGDAGLC